MTGQYRERKARLDGIALFLITKISKGYQNGEMEGTIRDRSMAITEIIRVGGGKISTRYLSITPANGVWNTWYQGTTLLGQR